MTTKPLVFLTRPSNDKPPVLNVSRNGACERAQLTDAQIHLMMVEIAEYLMVSAQRRDAR